ncbi:MAG: transposase, partial [Massilia sp.]|nr:transposase [Massilia sp.]
MALHLLAVRLGELLRERSCLHAHETAVRQLYPGSGRAKHAYMWAYPLNAFDDGQALVVFACQASRAGSHARAFL